jgi:hypothetical protein
MSAAQKTAILAQVGHFYFGAVGQFYVGANKDRKQGVRRELWCFSESLEAALAYVVALLLVTRVHREGTLLGAN